jgi:hypothetical protein
MTGFLYTAFRYKEYCETADDTNTSQSTVVTPEILVPADQEVKTYKTYTLNHAHHLRDMLKLKRCHDYYKQTTATRNYFHIKFFLFLGGGRHTALLLQ